MYIILYQPSKRHKINTFLRTGIFVLLAYFVDGSSLGIECHMGRSFFVVEQVGIQSINNTELSDLK